MNAQPRQPWSNVLISVDWDRRIERFIERPVWEHPWAMWLAVFLCAVPAITIITTPLSLSQQALFGVGCFMASVWINRLEGRLASLIMMMLSLLASSRYMYWRLTESVGWSLPNRTWVDLFFSAGLIAAELYAFIVLFLGYFQVMWPLQRKPVPMPRDPRVWPTVDVYIPTYNEPMKVVRPTVLAALDIDWPKDKLRVHVLDDGRREEFKKFCEEVGAIHITRTDSKHAKAGNLNRAMQKTNGEFIAIFDCDHIPTRSFLQVSIGWFLKDPKLAMLQTPHHFFSPDPFERNLGTFRKVPNEGELFYGLLQDGNDFWNACFFCGSCAVLRRKAILEVGGVAVETVTEDAHTALKMHRRGWHTAYINIAQAAGLATESLSAHVGQRIRWARGMAQIFRIDNPLIKRGLSLGQRLCYTNAMLHFFYGLPRIVFLTAPLSYLFFEAHIIEASALTIAAFAAPHLMHANLTNSRLQGPYRHSFWAEVYETVLATYIMLPTAMAMINPKLGSFNVTAKGGLVQQEYFDRDIAKPYIILLLFNVAGLIVGAMRFMFWNTHEIDTVVLNMLWTVYNLVITGAALSVAWESKQIRRTIRVNSEVQARVRTPGGAEVEATTIDISEGGTALRLKEPLALANGSDIQIALAPGQSFTWIDASVARSKDTLLTTQFKPLSLDQERALVYAIFGRADAWVKWAETRPVDNLTDSFKEVISLGVTGTQKIISLGWRALFNEMRESMKRVSETLKSGTTGTATAWVAAAVLGALCLAPLPVNAQDATVAAPAAEPAKEQLTRAESRVLSFEQLGQRRPIRLRGVQGELAIPMQVRDDEVVTRAKLTLKFSHSPSLIFPLSHINVLVNNELAATIPLTAETAGGAERSIEIDPRLFVQYNQIGLQMIAHYTMDCEDPVHTTLWSIVSNRSTLEIDTKPLDIASDLNLLPQPFFDERDQRRVTLPFVFAATPSIEELEAAGVVASWFGAMANYRGASFPVYINELPRGHAIVFASGGKVPAGVDIGAGGGSARLAVVSNPVSPESKLLVVSGGDGMTLNMAARSLTLGSEALAGSQTVIREFTEPAQRQPYDAPRWIPTDRPVQFGELTPWALEVSGLYPDVIKLPFHMPPDLFTWRGKGMKLNLKYRYTPTVGSKSTLNVNINNEFVEAIALSYTGEEKAAEQRINLPFVAQYEAINEGELFIPDYKFSSDNELQFQYYFERKKEGACKDVVLDNLRGSIDKDSTIDLTAFPHFTYLPDLALFANGGFPYTRMADLSETGIVLPDTLNADEVEAYLTLMGRLGNATGYPGFRFRLGRAADAAGFSDLDILVLGSAGNQPLLEQWADSMPMAIAGGQTQLRVIGPIERLRAKWEGRDLDGAAAHAGRVILEAGKSLGAIMSFESPLSSKRTVVVLTAGDSKRLKDVAELLSAPGKTQFIRGDLVLLNGDELNHYVLAQQYSVGRLPFLMALRWWFSKQPFILVVVALIAALLIATVMFRLLRRMALARKAGSA